MAPVKTPAIVLHAFRYGETSKIVRLLTPNLGVQSVLAKGAMRTRSKFGAGLEFASEGNAQIYVKESRELQTLGEFELTRLRRGIAADNDRFAVASVLAETVIRFASAESHPNLFAFMHAALDELEMLQGTELGLAAVSSVWGVIAEMGFAPALEVCAVDGRPVDRGAAAFSVEQGGFLCDSCSRGRNTSTLPEGERGLLSTMVLGHGLPADLPDARSIKAHRRLVIRFVRHHMSEGREMKALDYWESLP